MIDGAGEGGGGAARLPHPGQRTSPATSRHSSHMVTNLRHHATARQPERNGPARTRERPAVSPRDSRRLGFWWLFEVVGELSQFGDVEAFWGWFGWCNAVTL